MRYVIGVSLVLFMVFAPQAKASMLSESLSRMDAIIKEMQALRAEFAQLSALASVPAAVPAPAPAVLGAQSTSFFTKKLELGETNSDIKKIQKLLATDKEIYPYGVASGMFGPKTEEAIKNLQTRFGLKPVGAVGPATKALLELFIAAYPDDVYPADVLKKKPTVLGASTTVTPTLTPAPVKTPTVALAQPTPVSTGGAKTVTSMTAAYDNGDARVKIKYSNGTSETIDIEASSKMGVIDQLAVKTGQKKAVILGVIEFTSGSASNSDDEEDQAQEALDDAEDAIDDVQNDVDDADSDVDTNDTEDLLDEADDLLEEAQDAFDDGDYEDAIDLAKEAEDKADEAGDELDDAIDDAA